ncbi:hypothetical protein CLV63_11497 [Murinocardiopsis flavida]|uniref:Uncharacterized protein n=1 Tax=Murinocardiopsis flavida TaxID=645275 RepID=A0A2P8DEK4_9ACTN|nr:hypothetical protein CLV63_11497 [Murinocardiopsis flavida]
MDLAEGGGLPPRLRSTRRREAPRWNCPAGPVRRDRWCCARGLEVEAGSSASRLFNAVEFGAGLGPVEGVWPRHRAGGGGRERPSPQRTRARLPESLGTVPWGQGRPCPWTPMPLPPDAHALAPKSRAAVLGDARLAGILQRSAEHPRRRPPDARLIGGKRRVPGGFGWVGCLRGAALGAMGGSMTAHRLQSSVVHNRTANYARPRASSGRGRLSRSAPRVPTRGAAEPRQERQEPNRGGREPAVQGGPSWPQS